MEIRCLYILIGFIITLNSTAQDISKPGGIKLSQKEPDKSKEKTSSKADTHIQKTYNTNSSLYQQELTAEDMFKKGEEYEDTSDYAKAVKWYQKAAEKGHIEAQSALIEIYYEGAKEVPKDIAEAIKWCRRLAEQGHTEAQFSLGQLYEEGKDVSKDYAEAVKWYRKAAEQGNPMAQSSLAEMYKNGIGVSKDYTEAVKWYRKAS